MVDVVLVVDVLVGQGVYIRGAERGIPVQEGLLL